MPAEPNPSQTTTAVSPAAVATPGLWTLLREDHASHNHDLTSAGFQALAVHRIGAWHRTLPRPLRTLVALVYKPAFVFVRNVYGIELYATATVGRRVKIAHQSGIVIHPFAVIGDGCVLRHNVTIASTGHPDGPAAEKPPRLGDRVHVGAGATIFGGITVGDDVRIGPGVVVTTNVPAGSMVFATPPRTISRPTPVPGPADPTPLHARGAHDDA